MECGGSGSIRTRGGIEAIAFSKPMNEPCKRGRLGLGSPPPSLGEATNELASASGFSIELIVSGELAELVTYQQDHDEFFLVLAGRAHLEVAGTPWEVSDGDWALLPAQTTHKLTWTEPGTRWLVVRGCKSDGG